MTEILSSNLTAAVTAIGILLIVPVIVAAIAKTRSMRLILAPARKERRGQWKYQGQQLEARELLDAGMGNALEGESITIGDVTYDNVDMIALAQAITDSEARFFGASWCPHCANQKALFGDGASYLPYIEASTPSHGQSQAGIDDNITMFPTWIFADGTRFDHELSIEQIVQAAGITVPTGQDLYFDEIPDQENLKEGQSYHIALDGYSPNGYPLTYTVTSSSGAIQTTILQGNRSIRMNTNFGTMEFYLFEDEVSLATSRIIQLAQEGFYDGTIFHRVIDNFVIQGGDAGSNPDGAGGSNLPDIDDVFDPDLRNNETGMLSFAKTQSDDSNNSQFFITEGDQSHLDFIHSVFGFLTEGENVRHAISGTPTELDEGQAIPKDRPLNNVVLNSVEVLTDMENAVLRLKLPVGLPDGETVTVTVSDGHGHTLSRTFSVSGKVDNTNYNSFLSYIPDVTLTPGGSLTFQMSATSVDGDPVAYYTASSPPANLAFTVNGTTGELKINTSAGIAPGIYTIYVACSDAVENPTSGIADYQAIQVTVGNRPNLSNDLINLTEDSSVTFNPLDNDSGAGTDLSSSTLRLLSEPTVGEVVIDQTTGEMTYTPPANYNGTVSFQYTAANEIGLLGNTATVTLVVGAVNDVPEAYDDVFFADRNTATLLPILKNDDKGALDEADDAVIILLPSQTTAAGGLLSVVGDQIEYIPPTNFSGTDTFTYTFNDSGLETSATVTVDVRDETNFMVTAVTDITATDANGVVDSRPQSTSVIDEWDSFWIEVWITPDGTGGDTITAASATLNFDPTMYRASSVIIGPGFTPGSGNTVSNASGTAMLNATSSIDGLGAGGRVLLGRIRFTPLANGLDAPKIGESLGLDFSHFLTEVSQASMTVDGIGVVASPTIDAMTTTRLLPMIYDLNDDGRVGIGDFSNFVAAIGNPNSLTFIDFDLTSHPMTSGFSLFQTSFGSSFDSLNNSYTLPPALLSAAMSQMLLTDWSTTITEVSSLTTEDVNLVTAELPSAVISSDVSSNGQAVSIQIVDLPGNQLAKTIGGTIYLDQNAAGWGWFVDSTPMDSTEFDRMGENGALLAQTSSNASSRIDLLSVLMHELGHVAGLEHTDQGLMSPTLLPGERLLDWENESFDETFYIAAVDQFFSDDA